MKVTLSFLFLLFCMPSFAQKGKGKVKTPISASEYIASPCLVQQSYSIYPQPINNTYQPQTVVFFCYNVEYWDPNGMETTEWIHSVAIDFGSGWDLFTLIPIPPASCDGAGQWGWYDSWQGCQTGEFFGPGFAYESSSGIDAGANCNTNGFPFDNNPGNNFGDGGNGCAGINPNAPKSFCWSIQVRDDAIAGEDLHFSMTVYSDGDAGSWGGTGCFYDNGLSYMATVSNCEPIQNTQVNPSSCYLPCDGTIMIPENAVPQGNYNFTLTDIANQTLYSCSDCSPPLNYLNLCVGEYIARFEADSICFEASYIIVDTFPAIEVSLLIQDMNCTGDSITLEAVSSSEISYYEWIGPNGFFSTNESLSPLTTPGYYTLFVIGENGCFSDLVSINVNLYTLNISPSDTICIGDSILLTATGSDNYLWSNGSTADFIMVSPNNTSTYTVSAISAQTGCMFTAETTIFVEHEFPVLPLVSCAGYFGSVEFTWPSITTGFAINIENITGQTGIQTDSSYIVSDLIEGDTVTILFEIENMSGCGTAIELTCITAICEEAAVVSISNPGLLCLEEMYTEITLTASVEGNLNGISVWEGVGIIDTLLGIFSPDSSGVGWHTIKYTWSSDTCFSMASTLIWVAESLSSPIITCEVQNDSITFFWEEVDGAENYEVLVLTGQLGVFDEEERTFLVENLGNAEVVSIQVNVLSAAACGMSNAEKSCQTNCPAITLEIIGNLALCPDDITTLNYEITGDNTGSIQWLGACFLDETSGVIDAQFCDYGSHIITLQYNLDACSYETTAVLTIYPPEIPVLDMPIEACVGDNVFISVSNLSPFSTLQWNFDDGIIISEPPNTSYYEIIWETAGSYTVNLMVIDENGCLAEIEQTILLKPIENLTLSCQATVSSMLFSWQAITAAESYAYEIVSSSGDVILTGNTIVTEVEITDLLPEEELTITVSINGSEFCAESTQTLSCFTSPCPNVDLFIIPIDFVCIGNNSNEVFEAIITGGQGNGVSIWSGEGIIDENNGTFDALLVGIGFHDITLTYTEGYCTYQNTITVEVSGVILDIPSILYVCEGDYYEFCLPEEYGYTWSGPNNFSSDIECLVLPFFDETLEGIYTVNVDVGEGCNILTEISLVLIPNPITSLTSSVEVACPHKVFELSVETATGATISWYPPERVLCNNCPTTLGFIIESTNFIVQVVDDTGCEWLDTLTINIGPFCAEVPGGINENFLQAFNNHELEEIQSIGKEALPQKYVMEIWPNPVQATLNVTILGAKKGTLKIFTLSGHLVKEQEINSAEAYLDCTDLSAGTYLLQLKTEKKVFVEKIVIMH